MMEGSTKTLKQPHVQHGKFFTLTFLISERDNAGTFVLILVAGFPADGLFVGVVISNSVIGVRRKFTQGEVGETSTAKFPERSSHQKWRRRRSRR